MCTPCREIVGDMAALSSIFIGNTSSSSSSSDQNAATRDNGSRDEHEPTRDNGSDEERALAAVTNSLSSTHIDPARPPPKDIYDTCMYILVLTSLYI
jgi:hypothetical protein